MTGIDVRRKGRRSWATAALVAGCLSLVFLPGCRQFHRPSQTPASTAAKNQVGPKVTQAKKHAAAGKHAKAGQSAPAPAAAKVQPANAAQNVKAQAGEAGSELKAGMKEIQATISGDDSMVADNEMVNLNYATMEKLETLPGVSKEKARMIMDNRPYNTPLDLVYKKVFTQEEYDRIANRLVTWDNLWTKSD